MESDQRFAIVGRRLRRPDAGPRLTGYERYTDDLAWPGMYAAALVLSPYAHALIRGIDVAEAKCAAGVVDVVTSRELPEFARDDEPPERRHFFLASERVSYVGQPVAVVLATSAAEAELAAELVRVDYDPQPPIAGIEMARQPQATPVRPRTQARRIATLDSAISGGPNVNGAVHHQRGDVEEAFRDAAQRVERTFHSHAVYQGYLEPRSVVASGEPNGRLTIYTPTQGQFMVRAALARVLGMAETDIRVEPMTVGGGFGGKMVLLEPLAAVLALRYRRPVKLTLTRQQDLLSTTPAPESRLTVGLAASADGLLTGLRADLWFDTGYFSNSPYQLVAQMIGSYYRIPNIDICAAEVLTNRTGTGAYRAPGLTPMMFALETLVDELAALLQLSPLELRMRNVAEEGDLMADGGLWPAMDFRSLLHEASRSPLWTQPCADGEGVGLAIGGLRGGAESASASLRLNADGTLSVMVGSVDLTGTTTGLTQIAAEAFGASPELVRVTTASSDSAPQFGLTGGSKVLYSVGNAVLEAARDARTQALAIAADQLEAGVDDLEVVANRIQVRGAPDRSLALSEIHRLTIAGGSTFAPVFGRGNVANPEKAPALSVHLARVKVDRDTGDVRVTAYDAIHDVGRAINPAEVEAQIHGGVVQGFGWGLREALIYDDHGQLLTGSFMDYAIPKAADLPMINTNLVENPAPFGPFGAKGVGEAPVVAPAAAIANALTAAVGIRLTQLPITSERVWHALNTASEDKRVPEAVTLESGRPPTNR